MLVVEVEQPLGNWIWEAHLNGPINGVSISMIAEGDSVQISDLTGAPLL